MYWRKQCKQVEKQGGGRPKAHLEVNPTKTQSEEPQGMSEVNLSSRFRTPSTSSILKV
jgi:hypothetical protein